MRLSSLKNTPDASQLLPILVTLKHPTIYTANNSSSCAPHFALKLSTIRPVIVNYLRIVLLFIYKKNTYTAPREHIQFTMKKVSINLA